MHDEVVRWSVGKRTGRVVYARNVVVGIMDTPRLAKLASAAPDLLEVVKRWHWRMAVDNEECSCAPNDPGDKCPRCAVTDALEKAGAKP